MFEEENLVEVPIKNTVVIEELAGDAKGERVVVADSKQPQFQW